MKIVFRALCFSLAAVISTGATAAQTFDCKITETGRGGWVTERYIFKVDLAKNKATVLDGLVNHMFKQPISAKISDTNERTTRLKWHVKGVPAVNRATGSSSGNINLSYTAILNTKTQEVSVRGTVTTGGGAGSSGTSGSGTCKVSGTRSSALSEKPGKRQETSCVSGADTDRTISGCPSLQRTAPAEQSASSQVSKNKNCDAYSHSTLSSGTCY